MTGIEDTLREIVARFSPAAAKGLKATYQLRLTGEGGGEWHIKISDGKCELVGGAAEEADVGISASVEDWRGILTGEVEAMDVFYQGRLQLSGDLELALRLQELFVL